MKQSSIDWLIHQLTEVDHGCINKTFLQSNNTIAGYEMRKLFEQAKAIHKEEINEAYSNGSNDRLKNRINDDYYNETFNPQPKMDELTQLRKLAGLLQSAWYNGNWKAETYNEHEMEKIMIEQGYWPALPNPNQIGK